jgi:hypothetical protein
MIRAAALLSLLAVVGCGGAAPEIVDAPPSAPDAGAVLVLGTIDQNAVFAPLEGDQPLVPGGQGGFHVWLKFRVAGIAAGPVRMVRTVRRVADDVLILLADAIDDIGSPGADGFYEHDALPSFMCPTPIGVQVYDEPVRFDVKLLDPTTQAPLVERTAVVTPRCPPEGDPVRAYCLNRCGG